MEAIQNPFEEPYRISISLHLHHLWNYIFFKNSQSKRSDRGVKPVSSAFVPHEDSMRNLLSESYRNPLLLHSYAPQLYQMRIPYEICLRNVAGIPLLLHI